MNFYNEHDPFAAEWLRNLIAAGHIAPGVVDERSIVELDPDELAGFVQCHFFAGIGVWSYALRLAGWSDDRPIWTGSCPCQPFSIAGKAAGHEDERDLWPAWFRLVRKRRPRVVFGEQVASADGLAWFDVVSTDMEGEGYAVAAADLCAAGVGAPHIRQRLFFVADADADRFGAARMARRSRVECDAEPCGAVGGVAVAASAGLQRRDESGQGLDAQRATVERSRSPGGTYWDRCEWVACRDGKSRPVESGSFPLAYEAPARVGRLRAYGNAINAEVARVFIEAARGVID